MYYITNTVLNCRFVFCLFDWTFQTRSTNVISVQTVPICIHYLKPGRPKKKTKILFPVVCLDLWPRTATSIIITLCLRFKVNNIFPMSLAKQKNGYAM